MKLLSERIKIILEEHPELDGHEGQIGLAKIANASRSVVSQWLSGSIKSLKVPCALAIEEKLGYSHLWLMDNIGPKYVQRTSTSGLSEEALEVARAFEKMPSEGKSYVLKILDLDERKHHPAPLVKST